MPGLRQLRSFSTELMKLAAGVPDAGIRELLAFRRGEEFLPGGQLESNTEEEARHQAKFASPGLDFGSMGRLGLASGSFDLPARKKKDNAYQKVRDYAVTGMKGGLSGLGVMGAINTMRGKKGLNSMMAARRAAAGGASLALLDRAYRHDDLPKTANIGTIGVHPTPSGLRSPGAQLSQARETGLFRGVNHAAEGREPHSLQIGQKFRAA